MSMTLIAGEEPIGQLATTLGWTNALAYIDTLDEDSYPTLREFANDGFSEDVEMLHDEAKDAAEAATNADVKGTLENLVKLLESTDEEFVLID